MSTHSELRQIAQRFTERVWDENTSNELLLSRKRRDCEVVAEEVASFMPEVFRQTDLWPFADFASEAAFYPHRVDSTTIHVTMHISLREPEWWVDVYRHLFSHATDLILTVQQVLWGDQHTTIGSCRWAWDRLCEPEELHPCFEDGLTIHNFGDFQITSPKSVVYQACQPRRSSTSRRIPHAPT